MNRKIFDYLFILILLVADQVSKAIVASKIDLFSSRSVIRGFFNLTHIRNRGAIFGFFSQYGSQLLYLFLTLASFLALGLVVYYFFKTPAPERLMKISLSLILAGALGNLIDRVFRGYVIDFLDFYFKKWHWPAFNVADSCVTVGAVLLIYVFLFRREVKCTLSS
jgi:signal peptidase II